MTTNQDSRINRRLPAHFRKNTNTFRSDPGPYIGVVKDNIDPARSGRLRIWIPDLAGDEDNPTNWRTVWYASPYIGTTNQKDSDDWASGENRFSKVQHTYGMWYPVPDIGNLVLCIFVAGDPNRGFWFAGILNQLGHHMIPAIGSSDKIDTEKLDDNELQEAIEPGQFYPVAEFNEFQSKAKLNWRDFTNAKKPLHEPQVKILLEQGLDRYNLTKNRGVIKSTSQRETPSTTFGFSTPGRPYKQAFPTSDMKLEKRNIKTRIGGHTFVMDDGDKDSTSNLTRWRSAGGHEILMDDEEKILYITNSNGSVWIEMTNTGHLNIYASNSINVRTKQDFNLHVDKNVNIDVGGTFNLKVKKNINIHGDKELIARSGAATTIFGSEIKIGSDGNISTYTPSNISFYSEAEVIIHGEEKLKFNSGKGPKVEKPKDLPVNKLDETEKVKLKWEVKKGNLVSISPIVPTHEPWTRLKGESSSSSNAPQDSAPKDENNNFIGVNDSKTFSNKLEVPITQGNAPVSQPPNVVTDSSGKPITDGSGNPVLTRSVAQSTDPGIVAANQQGLTQGAPLSELKKSTTPNPESGIGNLTKEQTRALMTQISYNESRGDYTLTNQYGYIGRYQMSAAALVETGHISRAAFEQYGGLKGGNRALSDPNAWTGKDGVTSKEDFLKNSAVQEKAALDLMKINYNRMISNGAIKNTDDPSMVGGMLATAQLLGANGAKNWRNTASGKDANNVTGATYFNRGRYAIDILA
jgi:hypothetical protein